MTAKVLPVRLCPGPLARLRLNTPRLLGAAGHACRGSAGRHHSSPSGSQPGPQSPVQAVPVTRARLHVFLGPGIASARGSQKLSDQPSAAEGWLWLISGTLLKTRKPTVLMDGSIGTPLDVGFGLFVFSVAAGVQVFIYGRSCLWLWGESGRSSLCGQI